MDVIVKVFGSEPPCAKCKVAHDIAKNVSERIGEGVVVEKHGALSEEGDKYGIMMNTVRGKDAQKSWIRSGGDRSEPGL